MSHHLQSGGKPQTEKHYPVKSNIIYLIIVSIVFLFMTWLFLFLPRPTYSELEKRELSSFPSFNDYKDKISEYPSAISLWFSDSEPYRDSFMSLSMHIRDFFKYKGKDEETISFHKSEDTILQKPEEDEEPSEEKIINPMADENAKMANAGVIVVGKAPEARALMAFGGSSKSGGKFIETLNEYEKSFPECNIYAMIASSAGEFYLPDKARKLSNPEGPTLSHIQEGLSQRIKYINVHDVLSKHINEDIYLRTDHHWAPLGAFYAAEEFAKTAELDFKSLRSYEKFSINNFVGSMYGYSKDIAIKKSPETFVYYKPKDIEYTSTFITYFTDSNYGITSESKPFKSQFFKTYKDGNGGAYSTFIGGDQNLVHVETGKGDRKLLLIKDSFGNAIPGYLFYSFSDIFIVDFRYFNRNMKKFVEENEITDILFTFNIFNACNSSSMMKVKKFLSQGDRVKPKVIKIENNMDSVPPLESSETENQNSPSSAIQNETITPLEKPDSIANI